MALDIIIISALIIIGISLMLAEVFLLPGITVAGIVGSVVLIGTIFYAFYYLGETAGYITLIATSVIGIASFIFLIKSRTLDKFALKKEIDSTVDQTDRLQIKEGDTGITLSRINPMGKVEFADDVAVEVKSFTGEFIDANVHVKVVKTDGYSIFVERI